ncbi:MAG: ABC transporter substrate-binding protein, partial [Propionibacteriaceae bacterium]|nr:ABC transporter substrate-binding protein [Propionibacteriaceae bacterium]
MATTLAVAVMLGGCAGGDPIQTSASPDAGTPSPTGDTTPTSEIPLGGTVTMRLGADISSWDPCVIQAATVPGTMGDVLNSVYGALVYTDDQGVVQPGMAESLTTEDGVTWTFKLRPEVTFTDGTPYDAAAVKFAYDRAADPANACTSQQWIATWTSVEAVDDLTVKVTLPSANANFNLQVAELAAFVGSPASLEGVTDKTAIQPVGAGPFMLESRDQGVKTVLKKNPGYWDAPRPYIDQYVLLTIPESNTGQNMVVQGDLDFMMGYAYQYGRNASMPGVTTKVVPINGYNIAYFVTDGGPTGLFNDARARQAVAVGVDRA